MPVSNQSAVAFDKSADADGQVRLGDFSLADRLRDAAQKKGWNQKALSAASGVSTPRVSDYWKGPKEPTAANLFALARALSVSAEWLALGRSSQIVDASDADFVGLPRFDLRQITEAGRGNRIDTIPFRRDWLNRRVGTAQGLWVAELPSSYDELNLTEGDAVICSDLARNEVPPDNTTCIFLGDGLFVARFRTRPVAGDARQVGPADLADDVQPIARIRARLLTAL